MSVKKGTPAKYGAFCLLALIMGFCAGALVWGLLRLMDAGIDLLWQVLPAKLGTEHSLIYALTVCLLGGLLIGLFQKKHGVLPDNMEQVIGRIKKSGRYPYDRLHIIAIAALLPLIFGGALGPEAGLSGIIAGLCSLIGDRLRYKGAAVATLTETGIMATLGVIFGAPFFGIVNGLEPDDGSERYKNKLVSKRTRIIIYICGAAGGMLAFYLLGSIFNIHSGLPRFGAEHAIGWDQWKWAVPLIATGIITALFFKTANVLLGRLRQSLNGRVILRCLIAGACVAVCGYLLPQTMFSGEHQLAELIAAGNGGKAALMICTAFAKLLLLAICLNMGWRGGNIFPLIFCGALLGYAFAAITGMDGAFAAALVIAATYAYIVRKPVTVAAILLLCFPITYIIPIAAAAFIAAKCPTPFNK